jgi:uncharacterized protein YaaN involved in tellurite resistance
MLENKSVNQLVELALPEVINLSQQERAKGNQMMSELQDIFSQTSKNAFLLSNKIDEYSPEISKQLSALTELTEDIIPNDKKSFLSRALSFLPGNNILKDSLKKFENAGDQIEKITFALQEAEKRLIEDSVVLTQELGSIIEAVKTSNLLIKEDDEKTMVLTKVIEDPNMDDFTKQEYKKMLDYTLKHKMDLQSTILAMNQNYINIQTIHETNNQTAEYIQRIKTTAISLIRQCLTVHIATKRTEDALTIATQTQNLTNSLMRENAARGGALLGLAQKANASTLASPEVLKESQQILTKSIEEYFKNMDLFSEQVKKITKDNDLVIQSLGLDRVDPVLGINSVRTKQEMLTKMNVVKDTVEPAVKKTRRIKQNATIDI